MQNNRAKKKENIPAPGLFGLLKRYSSSIALLVAVTIVANALSLAVPKIISGAIDSYGGLNFSISNLIIELLIVALLVFIFTYLQNIVQVYTSERVARDMRNDITAKISVQPYSYIESATPSKLLTNLTSDVDAVKTFVSIAISSLISSVFLIVGVSILLVMTDRTLGLTVLAIIPFIAGTFYIVLSKVSKLFVKSQEAIDWLNKVISESILGAALIRLLNSQNTEYDKFLKANTEAKRISLQILAMFAGLMPIITFLTNIATLVIVLLGGHFIISETMSLGNFTAFNSYLAILIFPIMIIGFMSMLIAQAQASYGRILGVLHAPDEIKTGGLKAKLRGDIEVKNVTLNFGQKPVLKNISFSVKTGEKIAIIGPTAAGKTQLLYILTGLVAPSSGDIYFDGKNINKYDKASLHNQVGFVFQDSVIFNLNLRENIAFSNIVDDKNMEKAIATAELREYIDSQPEKLDSIVSERGTSLSGGQKQRIMLARALTLDPRVLLLDDFTARVDQNTERTILKNISKNYPGITLISVTQKISSIEHYDKIILLMEGEILASGTHEELMNASPEYQQIYRSQQSTQQYEI
jgi:ATP-binding cassette subfamily B protein